MVKVQVLTNEVQTRSGEKDGKRWVAHEQEAWIDLGKAFPERILLRVEDPYPVGVYSLSPRSLRVGQFGRLEIGFEVFLDREIEKK